MTPLHHKTAPGSSRSARHASPVVRHGVPWRPGSSAVAPDPWCAELSGAAHTRQRERVRLSLLATQRQDIPTHRRWA